MNSPPQKLGEESLTQTPLSVNRAPRLPVLGPAN